MTTLADLKFKNQRKSDQYKMYIYIYIYIPQLSACDVIILGLTSNVANVLHGYLINNTCLKFDRLHFSNLTRIPKATTKVERA